MAGATWTPERRNELALRMVSAAFLVPFAIYIVWSGGLVSALGCGLFAAILAYEWVRMTNSPLMTIVVTLAIFPAIVAWVWGTYIALIVLFACAVIAGFSHPLISERFKSGFGLFYVAGMPLALFALRVDPHWNGLYAAMLLMAIVWVSDTGAFFTGRTLGGPSLSSISPSKTWSGAIGGVGFSALAGVLIANTVGGGVLAWALAGGSISIFAQVGDMFESVMKRQLGVKDASDLLPGHGGVMDRVDGLGIAAAIGVIVLLAVPALSPALGLAA